MSFFAELKRRNVFRAAAFYAARAWLLVQIATQVFPFFHIAEWVVRWIVIAAAIGFPFAMLFSWFYEWTPHGLQLEHAYAGGNKSYLFLLSGDPLFDDLRGHPRFEALVKKIIGPKTGQ
jgi:hypothetical protein